MIDAIDSKAVPPTGAGRAPPAPWLSDAARDRFAASLSAAPDPDADIPALRRHYDALNRERLATARRLYPVAERADRLGGVAVDRVVPAGGTRGAALLVNLHGGAFAWGAGAGALLEAVPVAAATGLEVVTIDYRLAPEHVFPAAVDDAVAVLAALDREAPGRAIGLYGCSAGAVLTAQAVARLVAEDRSLPRAIAMLHGAGMELGGDSVALAATLNGTPESATVRRLAELDYLAAADPADPLVFPGEHPALLARFPPAFLASGSRDFAAGAVATMHRRLRAAGVAADLVMFDGLWHAHHVDTDLPESRELYALLAAFFTERLG